jgi:hypothetical protein
MQIVQETPLKFHVAIGKNAIIHLKPLSSSQTTPTSLHFGYPPTNKIRACYQPESREDAAPHHPAFTTRPRRRGHRMNPKHPSGPPMTLGNMREMGDHDGYVV